MGNGEYKERTRRQVAERSSAVDDIRELPSVGVGTELPSVRDDGVEGVIVGGFGDVDEVCLCVLSSSQPSTSTYFHHPADTVAPPGCKVLTIIISNSTSFPFSSPTAGGSPPHANSPELAFRSIVILNNGGTAP